MKYIIWILVEGTEADVLDAHQSLRRQAIERHDREYDLGVIKDVMPARWGQIGMVKPYKHTRPPGCPEGAFRETPRPMPFSEALDLLLVASRGDNVTTGRYIQISPGGTWLMAASVQAY